MPSPFPLPDGFSSIALLLPLLLLPLLIYFRGVPGRKKQLQLRLPPSPPKLPLLGNLHQLGPLPHRPLCSLASRHGPLMLLHMGQVPTLVISSADAAREVMKTHDLAFATRPPSKPADVLTYGCRNVSFAPYGEYWRQAKKAAVVHLLNPKKVQSFRRVREEEVTLMLESISAAAAPPTSTVDLSEVFYSFANGLVTRIVAGSCSERDERTRLFREVIDGATAVIGAPRLDDLFPSLAWLGVFFPAMDSKLGKVFKKLDALLDQIVQEHERRDNKGEKYLERDFVDVLLSIQRDPAMDFSINRNDIKTLFMDMVAAGTDTSYTVLEWAMAELVKNPEVMDRAQREVREVAGGKPAVTEDAAAEMGYLRAVVKEVLRLRPPAPLLLPRESMADVRVMGYDVPARTRVLVNAWAIGRDPAWWKAPDEFRPERFLSNLAADFRGSDFQFIPFGAGRRMCPGIGFALCGIELALANLLNRFDWGLPDGVSVEDFDMEEAPGITVRRKGGLRLVAIPRGAAP